MKRAAVIEYAVNYDAHSSLVTGCDKVLKKAVACFEIFPVCTAHAIFLGFSIVRFLFGKHSAVIPHNAAKMRINMVIILCIILMIGGRDKERIKIQHFHA